MYQKSGFLVKRALQSLNVLLYCTKWEERRSRGCVSSDQEQECNFVVKDYQDLCLRLLPGQTRAEVNYVLCYFGGTENLIRCTQSGPIEVLTSYFHG